MPGRWECLHTLAGFTVGTSLEYSTRRGRALGSGEASTESHHTSQNKSVWWLRNDLAVLSGINITASSFANDNQAQKKKRWSLQKTLKPVFPNPLSWPFLLLISKIIEDQSLECFARHGAPNRHRSSAMVVVIEISFVSPECYVGPREPPAQNKFRSQLTSSFCPFHDNGSFHALILSSRTLSFAK